MAQTAASGAATPQFETLEEKVRRAAELLAGVRKEREEHERELHKLRAELAGKQRQLGEVDRERSEVRRRIERLIKQIDSLTAAEGGG